MVESQFPSIWQMMSSGIYVMLCIALMMMASGPIMACIDLVAKTFGRNKNRMR